MKVITNNPIITATHSEVENFMNAFGPTRRAKKAARKKNRPKGQFVQKVKNFGKKVVDSGVLPILAAQLGNAPASDLPPIDAPTGSTETSDRSKPEMEKSTKILIGVGVAAMVGVGIYLYTKNQGK